MTEPEKTKSADNNATTKIQILTIENRLDLMDAKVSSKLDRLFEKQEEFCERMEESQEMHAELFTKLDGKVDQISSALYEPESGVFARLKHVENISIPAKEGRNRIFWTVVTTVIGVLTTGVISLVIANIASGK